MLTDYIEKLNELDSERKYIKKDLISWKQKKKDALKTSKNLEQARGIFQTAIQTTQRTVSKQISVIVSNALKAVFDDPYSFKLSFEKRRNSNECDLLLVKDGHEMKPMDSCGYGVADIVSLALRIAYWRLGNSSNLIIMDEPTRNLSLDRQPLASEMIKKLSSSMNIQFIIVTHQDALAKQADKVFNL